jgi:hypothetical protein
MIFSKGSLIPFRVTSCKKWGNGGALKREFNLSDVNGDFVASGKL